MMADFATFAEERPWWRQPGSEECPHCLRSYHLEVGYRCVTCDGPVCPVCVVTVRETESVYCPACHREEAG